MATRDHEGYCRADQVRNLTAEELILAQKNEFWALPQQFYQSPP